MARLIWTENSWQPLLETLVFLLRLFGSFNNRITKAGNFKRQIKRLVMMTISIQISRPCIWMSLTALQSLCTCQNISVLPPQFNCSPYQLWMYYRDLEIPGNEWLYSRNRWSEDFPMTGENRRSPLTILLQIALPGDNQCRPIRKVNTKLEKSKYGY